MNLVRVVDRADLLERVLLSDISNGHTRRAYSRALKRFLGWYRAEGLGQLSRQVIEQYRAGLEKSGLATSSINQELSSVRRMLERAARAGLIEPEAAREAAGVSNTRSLGQRVGKWLTAEQAKTLLLSPDEETLKGKRDRAILAVLIGCGLRREELISLEVEHVQMRDGRWAIPDLSGKGNRVRLVPVPGWVKERLDVWTTAGGIREKKIFRAVRKNGSVRGDSLSATAVWKIVLEHARAAGIEKLTPHDLRRTCAKLCKRAGGDVQQIQFLLGHSSIQTTERYLGGQQEIEKAVNDRLFRRIKL
jgi:integrase/recombinase XerD